MANVKFYRLGLNGGVSNASYLEYTSTSDGRIVFALVKGENDSDSLEHYIWANGIEYHVADASALLKVEHTLNVLLDGAPADTSIGKMIQDALDGYELTAENFVKLVDSTNSNVQVLVVDSSIVLTAPGSHANITVGTVSPEESGLTPMHGDYYVKEETLSDDPNVEPRRTAYIYNGDLEKWQALDGNVDAENVYFPEGFLRTLAWGTQARREEVKTDEAIIGKNLKEVLEYYLVEEIYKGNFSNAILNTASWKINASGGKATPNDLYTYVSINNTAMNTNSSLVEVGSIITIRDISVSTTPMHTGTSSVTGSAAKVSNMFKYSVDGTTTSIVDSSSSSGTTPSVTFEYSTNFNTANASLSLKSSNSSIFSNSSANGLMTSTISLDASSGTLSEGKLTMTLSYSNDASASRTINSSVIATTVSVYPVSNKNNVSTGKLIANGLIPTDSHTKATNNITKDNTNVNITAVYPIYTNCAFVTTSTAANAQPPQLKDASTGWCNNGHGDSSIKLPLLNYIASDLNCVITIGETNPNEGANMAIAYMYVPKGRTFKVDSMATYNTDANKTFSGWVPETLGRKTWEKDSSTFIEVQGNQVEYDIYKNDATAGKCAFILTINKK